MEINWFITASAVVAVVNCFFVLYLIIQNRDQRKNRITWLLILNVFSVISWVLLTYFELMKIDSSLKTIYSVISNAIILIGIIFLLMFFQTFSRPEFDYPVLLLLISQFCLVMGLQVSRLILEFQDSPELADLITTPITIINLAFVISFLFFLTKEYSYLNDELIKNENRKQLKILFLVIIIATAGNIPIVLIANFYNNQFFSLAFVLVSITSLVMVLEYQNNPMIAYAVAEKSDLILIIDKAGSLIHSKKFIGEANETDNALISSALSAIRSILSEFYKETVKPLQITFDNNLILLEFRDNYFGALFCKQETILLRNTLKEFMDETAVELEHTRANEFSKRTIHRISNILEKKFYFLLG